MGHFWRAGVISLSLASGYTLPQDQSFLVALYEDDILPFFR
jgi:hypothetical protein